MDLFIHQVLSGLATGGIYASVALALVMIYQATHLVNFAQGELAMFATYICWTLLQAGFSYWVAFLSTVVLAFVGGVVIQRVIMMGGILLYAFAGALLGGIDSPGGAVVGGFLVSVIENVVGMYLGTEVKLTVALIIIVSVLVVKPTGLFGKVHVARV